MKVITVLNEKGGVGKTTLSTTLAGGLAIRGARVVLADSDMQANATSAFGLKKEPGFYDLIARETAIQNSIRQVKPDRIGREVKGELYVIPGNQENMHLATSVSSVDVVFNAIDPLRDFIDYFIIDTAPTQTMFHVALYVAGDAILYPTLLAAWSISGVVDAWKRREAANVVRGSLGALPVEVIGIQPTMCQMNVNVQQDMLNALRDRFGAESVLSPIARRAVWTEVEAQKIGVFAYAPESPAATEAWALIDAASASVPA